MSNRQAGFTLIELIVVIVILGILAATALPKFGGMQSAARIGTLTAARGAVTAAVSIASSTYQALGSTDGTVTLDGTAISLVFGYPVAYQGSSGIYTAAGLSADYSQIMGTNSTVVSIFLAAAPTPTACGFSYTQSTAANNPPVIGANVTSGC